MPDGTNYFNKIYICFAAVKEGWRGGCRRIINLDGCFLKSFCQGELLCVIGRDANNGIFPISWAIVCVENKDNWKWFIENLAEDLQCRNEGSGLVVISDQHKGLVEAVKEVFPTVEHRRSARHIYANVRKKFSGAKFENLFWRESKATTEAHFNTVMKDIEKLNLEAIKHLMDRDLKTWSLAFFRVRNSSCEFVENGFSESFNSVIFDARKKPIISMLEDIRIYVMQRMKGHNKTTCTQVPSPPKTNVIKKQKIMQTQESVNIQRGGEDVMGDAVEPQTDEVMRVNKYEQAVRVNKFEQLVKVNEAEELGRVNQIVGQVYTTCQPSKRKKSDRILKLKFAKRIEGEGSSVGSSMELD
ncbi:uncharacterized protein LOC111901502 [Lactuca sativa]|uniref:uncharacterized protein LOC111901502 n=1 Tax=Lactuca sativa TaxID=4236 RepID=UPI000CD8F33E|nr:uncharacterized protein LOC111901502 [Lactuca sativa]